MPTVPSLLVSVSGVDEICFAMAPVDQSSAITVSRLSETAPAGTVTTTVTCGTKRCAVGTMSLSAGESTETATVTPGIVASILPSLAPPSAPPRSLPLSRRRVAARRSRAR